jgi:release factor glutamine methyltransferase
MVVGWSSIGDPWEVLADPSRREALLGVVVALRGRGLDFGLPDALEHPDTVVAARIARREPVPWEDAVAVLGDAAPGAIHARVGGRTDEGFRLGFAVFLVRGTAAVVPVPSDESGRVYLAPDTAWFLQVLWPRLEGGRRAADLGTGTGFLAVSLTRRYDEVVATDRFPAAVATAELTRLANPHLADRVHVVEADVGAGLRAGSFDLVTANPPWVPSAASRVEGAAGPLVYADGGPTGFELPARFLYEGAALLAPGGRAAVLCLDGTLGDGRRPIDDVCADLAGQGFEHEVLPTAAAAQVPQLEEVARSRLAGLHDVRHVCVLIRRPP